MWEICFSLSVGILLLSAVIGFLCRKKGKPFYILFAGVLVAVGVALFPVCSSRLGDGFRNVCAAVLQSAVNAMRAFTLGCDDSLVIDIATYCPGAQGLTHRIWLVVLLVAAPFFTFGFAVSLLKNLSVQFRVYLQRNKDVYVFSQLNERSLLLATDIRKNHPGVALIFAGASGEASRELAERAEKSGAVCVPEGIADINLKLHNKKKKLSFFTMHENQTENLNRTMELVEKYRQRDNTHIYLFSGDVESEMILAAADKGKVKVRRINEVRSLVNRLLYEQGNVLFDSAKSAEDGTKHICAVVVGMGQYGTELAKALAWYGQMDGYTLEIHVFDKDPLAKDRFAAIAPELMSEALNGTNVPGEAQYKITVTGGIDVRTASFVQEIKKLPHATYIVVALGGDSENIDAAVGLRSCFAQQDSYPVINAIVHNSHQKTALESIKNYRGQPYDISFIGDKKTACSEAVLIGSKLENDALSRHLKWGEEDEFWTYEYNYRSSVASAIHMKARIHCGIPGAAKKESELTGEERDIIERLEHRRWNAYMRSEGYIYSGSREKSSRNDLAKKHPDLVPFDKLSEDDKRKDSRVGTT